MLFKSIFTGLFFFKAMAMAEPITLTRADGSTQAVTYGACNPTFIQDPQIASVQFNSVASCLLFEDNACQTTPVVTLEPIMFASGTNIRKSDDSELVAHYFICSSGQ